jgi:superfamily II DNA or RNA helicase
MNKRTEIQTEATNIIIKSNFKGLIDIAPRVGKTKILLDAISTLKYNNILVTVPFDTILDSWNTEKDKWGFGVNTIKIINQRSLNKESLDIYDVIICDEIHTLSDNQKLVLQPFKNKILGATGSLGDKTKKALRWELGLKPIFTYSIEQAIEDGIISNYEIVLHYVNLDNIKKNVEYGTKAKPLIGTELQAYNWFSSQFERMKFLSYNNPGLNAVKMNYARLRSNVIYNSVNKLSKVLELKKQASRCLIYTARTEVADKISKSYHSKSEDDNLESFALGKIKKLAVVQMVSMGRFLKLCPYLSNSVKP